jgi:2-oxoglutarate ferredoxin oxidoreductase subunit alpha
MTETPCVFVNVQRGGPSTGLPTLPGQADMMQARWGSHGDYGIIALCPNSPQEAFDLAIKAFNLAETYRVPVLLMLDECVGHMTERVVIPPAEEIEVVERKYWDGPKESYLPFKPGANRVPPLIKAGDGSNVHVTGLTHDERGYPVMTAAAQEKLVRRLVDKIRLNAEAIIEVREDQVEGADTVVVSFGITSRVAIPAIERARAEGRKVGHLRLITAWPFPAKRIRELSAHVSCFVVPEINYGQMVREVERCVAGRTSVVRVSHGGGGVHDPKDIYAKIVSCGKE